MMHIYVALWYMINTTVQENYLYLCMCGCVCVQRYIVYNSLSKRFMATSLLLIMVTFSAPNDAHQYKMISYYG